MIFWTTTVTVFGFYFLAQLGENTKEFSVPKSKLTIYCEAEFKEVEDQKTCLNDFEFAKISITQNPVQVGYFDLTYYDEYLALGNKLHGQRQTNNSPLKIMSVSELPEVFFEILPEQKNAEELLALWNRPYLIEGVLEHKGGKNSPTFSIIPKSDFENATSAQLLYSSKYFDTNMVALNTKEIRGLSFCKGPNVLWMHHNDNSRNATLHPCFGKFIIEYNFKLTDEKSSSDLFLSPDVTLSLFQLQHYDLSGLRLSYDTNRMNELRSIYDDHHSPKSETERQDFALGNMELVGPRNFKFTVSKNAIISETDGAQTRILTEVLNSHIEQMESHLKCTNGLRISETTVRESTSNSQNSNLLRAVKNAQNSASRLIFYNANCK